MTRISLNANGWEYDETRPPFALTDLGDADLAASSVMHTFQHAADPVPVDDENLDSFVDRWMARLALAAQGKLEHPGQLPG